MISLWIDSRTYKKKIILQSARKRSSNYLEYSKENVFGDYDAATLTMLYLKVLYDMVPQKF